MSWCVISFISLRSFLRDSLIFFFQAEDGIRDLTVTGVQTCALPILSNIGADRVSVLLGNGNGSFAAARDFSTGAGTAPWMLVAGDFNQDGKLDLEIGRASCRERV